MSRLSRTVSFAAVVDPLEQRRLFSALPSGWSGADVGTPGRGGWSHYSAPDSTYTIYGGGADIWNSADAFHYSYQSLTNNGSFTARVTAEADTNGWAKAGVMLRETTAADSRFALLAVTPAHGIAFQARTATHDTPTVNVTTAGGLGTYLRLTRSGSTITAAVSADNKTWRTVGTTTMSLGNTVQVGLAVTAHNDAQLGSATFGNVAISTTNTAASNWTVGTPDYFPRWESQTAAVNGKMYVFGGYVDRQLHATTEVDSYTPATDAWAHLAALPYAVTHAGTTVIGTTIYLAGGYLGQQTSNPPMADVVQAYDTAKNTWSQLPRLPAPVAAGGLAAVGRTLYFFGGLNPGRQSDNAKAWSLNLDNTAAGWQARAALPNARNHIGYAAVNGLVYAMGGLHLRDEAGGQQSEVDVYNPSTNTWAKTTSLPFGWSHFNDSTMVVNGKIVIVGGSVNGGDDGDYIANISTFDPATKKWTSLAPLPEERQAAAATYVNGSLVVIDGAIENEGGWPQQQVWLNKNLGV